MPALALALAGGCGSPDVDTAVAPAKPTAVPVIVAIDRVACAAEPAAGEVWQMELTVSDPQGAETVAAGAVSVRNRAGGEIGSYSLACTGGTCIGSFRSDYDNVDCALAGTISFLFTVTDADGHVSAPKTHET
ncbi:MAG: hypothetical protein Q7U06_00790 [Pseudomonadota bacterium]|nr:hypothetical protein [Pseudomonadota bacterium]